MNSIANSNCVKYANFICTYKPYHLEKNSGKQMRIAWQNLGGNVTVIDTPTQEVAKNYLFHTKRYDILAQQEQNRSNLKKIAAVPWNALKLGSVTTVYFAAAVILIGVTLMLEREIIPENDFFSWASQRVAHNRFGMSLEKEMNYIKKYIEREEVFLKKKRDFVMDDRKLKIEDIDNQIDAKITSLETKVKKYENKLNLAKDDSTKNHYIKKINSSYEEEKIIIQVKAFAHYWLNNIKAADL